MRLKIENPPYIILDVDSVVFDNRFAKKREGVDYTYKKVCGFHPLLFKWNGYVVDMFFRRGKCHTNHGSDTSEGLKRIVKLIRKKFNHRIPIIATMDGGYLDKKLCCLMEEELKIGYIMGGKAYKDIVDRVLKIPEDEFTSYKKDNSKSEWRYTEFYDKRGSWKKERRTVVTYQYSEENQLVVKCGKDLNILYTNLGVDPEVMEQLEAAGVSYLAETSNILMLAHNRGESELTHRHIKDFAGEKLPCQNFEMNEAYFMMMLLSFNLHQAFKRDCCEEIMGKKEMYPETCRRQLFDLPGIIVTHANKLVIKVANTKACETLQYVWGKAQVPI